MDTVGENQALRTQHEQGAECLLILLNERRRVFGLCFATLSGWSRGEETEREAGLSLARLTGTRLFLTSGLGSRYWTLCAPVCAPVHARVVYTCVLAEVVGQ